MRYLLICFLLFSMTCSLQVYAQNYFPVYSGNNTLFQYNGNIEVMHVDSVVAENSGLAYYFMQIPNPITIENCLPHKGAWAGSKAFSKSSICTFFNKNGDSIFLKPQEKVGKSWVFYKYSNGSYIEASVSANDWSMVLTLPDSIKTISLQLKNQSGTPVNDPVNSLTLKLSKNYGIVQTFDFINFPNSLIYQLTGLSSPSLGQQLLTPRQVYDYNIGDEFHYTGIKSKDSPYGEHYAYKINTMKKVSNKYISLNSDTVIYTFDQVVQTIDLFQPSSISYNYAPSNETHVFYDTVIYPSQYTPQAVHGYPGGDPCYHYSLSSGNTNGRLGWACDNQQFIFYQDSCWEYLMPEFFPIVSQTYLMGCGQTSSYYSYTGPGPGLDDEGYNWDLVYYKKGSETWGTPLLLSTRSPQENQSVVLYPNPIDKGNTCYINTGTSQANQLVVYDALGNKIMERNIDSSSIQNIDSSSLKEGLYIVQLVNAQNEYTTRKLMIK